MKLRLVDFDFFLSSSLFKLSHVAESLLIIEILLLCFGFKLIELLFEVLSVLTELAGFRL